MNFIFALAAFLAHLLKIEDKQALLSLFLEVLGSINGKVAYGKDAGNRRAGSKKINRLLVDFTLSLLLSSTKFCKEYFSIYFLKSY